MNFFENKKNGDELYKMKVHISEEKFIKQLELNMKFLYEDLKIALVREDGIGDIIMIAQIMSGIKKIKQITSTALYLYV
jgi:NurA-like 5'-3' nuclease